MEQKYIRNFSIIAHIDHGKSTLADRLLEITQTINEREYKDQILDSMELEREKGITIKSQVATMTYKAKDGNEYMLNLIDTPGHVDFSYEVSRALAACEGVILVIDASQGVQAQTLANMYQALEHNLEIIPVINKIDLPSADIDMCLRQIDNELGLDTDMTAKISAKENINIEEVLENIIKYIPPPEGEPEAPVKALIFDSNYDAYRGVIVSFRMMEGSLKVGDEIKFFQSKNIYKIDELGFFQIKFIKKNIINCGEVGYLMANIRSLQDTKTGDTITLSKNPCKTSLEGYKDVKPMVFSGIFPVDGDDYELLNDALKKLKLNDASLIYEPESSTALGFGFRCGFLGLLHLEIVQERLRREFDLEIIATLPSVEYKLALTNADTITISNPSDFPDPTVIDIYQEPYVKVEIIVPSEYLGNIMKLAQEKRGIQKNMNYLDERRVQIDYEMPLSEIIYDFHDRIKAISRGFASYDYNFIDYRPSELVRVDILVNEKKVDAFSLIVPREKSTNRGRKILERLKKVIPRHLFRIPLQAAIGSQIIARENISAMRKDVTAKCYGGDITRKRKLLEKQKEGKKKMREFGNVEIPQTAFIDVLKSDEDN